jgi:hypothetical protein
MPKLTGVSQKLVGFRYAYGNTRDRTNPPIASDPLFENALLKSAMNGNGPRRQVSAH